MVLPKFEPVAVSQNYGHFVISPLESGYGITLGNALRRVLLSSLPGAAVTSIRITGIHHEFSAIPHVREDTTRLILNVKQIRLMSTSEESVRIRVEVANEGPITAGDLICPPEVEVVNPDQYLLTADSSDVDLDIEMVVERGRGYSPAEERGRLPLGEIPVDAIFSPIRKSAYRVERTRIGQQTDYDRLNLEIWTDGTISPEDALRRSADILVQHFSLLVGVESAVIEHAEKQDEGIPSRIYEAPIEELELTVRAYNCLKRAGITKVGEILLRMEKGEDEMLAIRNFGKKSLDELIDRLREKNYLNVPGVNLSWVDDSSEADDEEDQDGSQDAGEEVDEASVS
jgi:DNA-directed RNA polymerase subunit alpha